MREMIYPSSLLSMLAEWERIEDIIQNSTKGSVRIIDPEGRITVGENSLSPLCQLIRNTETGLLRCQQKYTEKGCPREVGDGAMRLFQCHAGLNNFALSINKGDNTPVSIVGGGVFTDETDIERAARLMRQLQLDSEENLELLQNIPIISAGELKGMARVIKDMAKPFINSLTRQGHLTSTENRARSRIYMGDDPAFIDELTGAFTPSYLRKRLEEEVSRARRYGDPLCLVILEISNLARINERQGYAMGDTLLHETAQIIREHARRAETVARASGSRFALIMPRTDKNGARTPLKRLLEVIAGHTYQNTGAVLAEKPLISTGIGEYDEQVARGEQLMERALSTLSA